MKPKIATATPQNIEGTIFSVSYSDDIGYDRDVPSSYLRRLADDGYTVEVGECPATPAYTIHPSHSDHD